MTTMTDRTAALKAARAKDSNDKRRRVLQTVKAMESAGQPITAAAVATAAGVSTWLVYADGIREHLDAARARQRQAVDVAPPVAAGPRTAQQPVTAAPACAPTSPSLDTRSIGYAQSSTNSGDDFGCNSVPRSNNPTGPNSSHGSPRWKPRTANSSPNATQAPPWPKPPNAAPNNSRTTSQPPEKASDE